MTVHPECSYCGRSTLPIVAQWTDTTAEPVAMRLCESCYRDSDENDWTSPTFQSGLRADAIAPSPDHGDDA